MGQSEVKGKLEIAVEAIKTAFECGSIKKSEQILGTALKKIREAKPECNHFCRECKDAPFNASIDSMNSQLRGKQ